MLFTSMAAFPPNKPPPRPLGFLAPWRFLPPLNCRPKIRKEFWPRVSPCQSSSPPNAPLPNHPVLWRDVFSSPFRTGHVRPALGQVPLFDNRIPPCPLREVPYSE